MKFYLIAGEASGDTRGAEVMRSLVTLASARGGAVEFHGASVRAAEAILEETEIHHRGHEEHEGR